MPGGRNQLAWFRETGSTLMAALLVLDVAEDLWLGMSQCATQ